MSDQKFKADAGKAHPTLIQIGFAKAIRLVQATMEYGAQKYEAHSWRNVPNASTRYFDAAERHRQARMLHLNMGYESHLFPRDEESGLPHIAHEVFNLMALMELECGSLSTLESLCKFAPPPTAHKDNA